MRSSDSGAACVKVLSAAFQVTLARNVALGPAFPGGLGFLNRSPLSRMKVTNCSYSSCDSASAMAGTSP